MAVTPSKPPDRGSNPRTKKDKKPDPWVVPPFPAKGDKKIDTTYASVGHALSNWERLESQIALLYARLIGQPPGGGGITRAAERAYGAVRTFEGRAQMLAAASEAFFDLHRHMPIDEPNMDQLERDIDDLLKLLVHRASHRRNEIAHGIVQGYDVFVFDQSGSFNVMSPVPTGYVLGPPDYMTNKRSLSEIDVSLPSKTFTVPTSDGLLMTATTTAKTFIKTTRPKYLYSSVEMDRFGKQFMELVPPATDISNRVLRLAAWR